MSVAPLDPAQKVVRPHWPHHWGGGADSIPSHTETDRVIYISWVLSSNVSYVKFTDCTFIHLDRL